ncbi:MAG: 4-alpha-glucanotransferase [Clostridia bacterium]|nr:4-alpha-glucanotransferase [Clostridia bacterium]
MDRKSGVLMHVSSLFGDYSIGSFGNEALEFIDYISAAGFHAWQILPLCVTDEFNSPYKSPSSFSMNPYFLDLPTLYKKGLISRFELESAKGTGRYLCEYERLKRERISLLFHASQRAKSDLDLRLKMDSFFSSHPMIESAARFLAKKENGGILTEEWEFAWQFIQFELFSQWSEIKKHAAKNDVQIIGDIPMFVSLESAEVSEFPSEFLLDGAGRAAFVAGAPPDSFSPFGQCWGNPLYDYEKMAENGFSLWRSRIKYAAEVFDIIRIDHFRGFEAFWSIPAKSSDAREGRWVKAAGAKVIDAIKSELSDFPVIAEDLGEITTEVQKLLSYSGFMGTRVLQFALSGEKSSPHLPHNYSANDAAYTATHDNNTTLAYVMELPIDTRVTLFEYCGYKGTDAADGVKHIIDTVLRSNAALAIFPIQDLLGFGADTRMNTPGTAVGNWAYRITREQLYSLNQGELWRKNNLFGRV